MNIHVQIFMGISVFIFLDEYLGVEFLGRRVIRCRRYCQNFFHSSLTFCIPTKFDSPSWPLSLENVLMTRADADGGREAPHPYVGALMP